jgi:penicillin-binding protein 1A
VNALGFPLGGKTGTTDDYRNAWFVGFSPDLAVGVWIGFDDNTEMSEGSTGGGLAAPVFRDFMAVALENSSPTPFRIPSGVRLVRIDAVTGLLPNAGTERTILEAFRPDTEPTLQQASSPFVFGGTAPIDPRIVSNFGFGGSAAPVGQGPGPGVSPDGAIPAANAQQQPQNSEDLGGLY